MPSGKVDVVNELAGDDGLGSDGIVSLLFAVSSLRSARRGRASGVNPCANSAAASSRTERWGLDRCAAVGDHMRRGVSPVGEFCDGASRADAARADEAGVAIMIARTRASFMPDLRYGWKRAVSASISARGPCGRSKRNGLRHCRETTLACRSRGREQGSTPFQRHADITGHAAGNSRISTFSV